MPQRTMPSPVGPICLTEQDERLVSLDWHPAAVNAETPLLLEAARQLEAYFAGQLTAFDLPLRLDGSAFHRSVWRVMQHIPYGQTLTYGEVASELDSAPRAVGGACGRNPIAIIVPCHRILGSGGTIGGYSGGAGIATKRVLLALERSTVDAHRRATSREDSSHAEAGLLL